MTLAQDALGYKAVYVYDALGRVRMQKDQVYTLSMQYDGAGRRTQMSWGDDTDGVADAFITYDYDATGAMKTIREGGVNALATFAYDDLGRRALLTRGNGVKTSYGYTGPNLSSLGLDLSGSSNDQTYIYGYNAAGQLVSRTGSNEAYAWTGHVETGRGYTANALNQYTQAGSIVPTYDARGNLTSGTAASTPTYAYNVNNALVTSSTGTRFYQDPVGRLKLIGNSSAWQRQFEYDGDHIVTERRASDQAVQYMYVYGPGDDEPLVMYDYTTGTQLWRYLVADERGSVVAVTHSTGGLVGINT